MLDRSYRCRNVLHHHCRKQVLFGPRWVRLKTSKLPGQYDASLGQVSNERSGRAILARQKESDTGTYHYVDNLARAVRYVTRQFVDLIPKIYDTQRIARIIGIDGETNMVKIDPSQQEPVKKIIDQTGVVIDKIYNPSVGRYDVVVTQAQAT